MTRPVRRKADVIEPLERLAAELARRAGPREAPSSGAAAPPAAARRAQPGKLRPVPGLERAGAERLLRSALTRACGGRSGAADRGVLWRDADDELVVYPGRATLATGDRLIVVSVPVYTDETGETEVVIPFVTTAAESALGLVAATETKPRGLAAVVDVFGDTLLAVVWAALVEAAAAWAGAAGDAAGHGRLAPAGLAATKAALLVSAQEPFEPEAK